MKLLTIIGARPQFIKASALSRALSNYENLQEVTVHTGQHYDENMSDVFFRELSMPVPSYNLNINGGGHGEMTGTMMQKLEPILLKEKPDWVVVYGDTNSTLAGSLTAVKLHIPVAHVEAGLRSFNNKMPEEINRILTDRVSSLLFCPSDNAVKNLHLEGFDNYNAAIHQVGDIMYDSALFCAEVAKRQSKILESYSLKNNGYILCTIHRAENTDDPKRLSNIIEALNEINKQVPVIVPLHPRTKKLISLNNITPEFIITAPVGYFDMIQLIQNSRAVMTDSGGLQKEAFFFKKHCLIMRDETEWPELVEFKNNFIVGTDKNKIIQALFALPKNWNNHNNPYGSGNTAQLIAQMFSKM